MWVIDSIFDEARTFGDGLARVKINDKWKFIDIYGKSVDGKSFDEILTALLLSTVIKLLIQHKPSFYYRKMVGKYSGLT